MERFHETLYGQVRAIRIGLADHFGLRSGQVEGSLLPWIVQHAVYQINRYFVRSDGRTSFEKVFNKPQRSPVVHFRERVLAHIQLSRRLKTCRSGQHLKKKVTRAMVVWLGKGLVTGMRVVSLSDGHYNNKMFSEFRIKGTLPI